MSKAGRSRVGDVLTGALAGALAGLIAKDLDLYLLISYWGERSVLVVAACALGGVIAATRARAILYSAVAALSVLWLLAAFTPMTHWLGRDLPRHDELTKSDAVFVLASSMQPDGDFTSYSMSRLLRGLELLGEGWAPILVLSETADTAGRYERSARRLMDRLGLAQQIVIVGPVRNTHDEAVAVAALCREEGFERLLVVTSPSHSRRAAAALEAEGVVVTSSPSMETSFDYENLAEVTMGDHHVRSFGVILHERVGILYYRLKGWIS